MDQELIAYLDERFRRIDEQFRGVDERFRETWQHMDARFEQVHEEIRHTRVEVEDMRRHVGLLAEGVINMNEKLDRFQGEVKQRFDETHSFIKASYSSLEGRVHTLEVWRETKERDPIEIIREHLKNGTI
jgi:predicted  nucleic acid-binding Zn-ribbon protein